MFEYSVGQKLTEIIQDLKETLVNDYDLPSFRSGTVTRRQEEVWATLHKMMSLRDDIDDLEVMNEYLADKLKWTPPWTEAEEASAYEEEKVRTYLKAHLGMSLEEFSEGRPYTIEARRFGDISAYVVQTVKWVGY